MRQKPGKYDIVDFKVCFIVTCSLKFFHENFLWQILIPMELLDHLEDQYIPCNHPVFELMPPIFHECASTFYDEMGSPVITIDTFWHSYRQLLQCFFNAGHITNPDQQLANVLAGHFGTINSVNEENVALLPGMKELHHSGKVVGDQEDVGNESDPEYAEFTSDHKSEEPGGGNLDQSEEMSYRSAEDRKLYNINSSPDEGHKAELFNDQHEHCVFHN